MTARIIQLRDYETPEERQLKIERLDLRIVEDALNGTELPDDFPSQYRAPEGGDCA